MKNVDNSKKLYPTTPPKSKSLYNNSLNSKSPTLRKNKEII